MLSMPLVVVLLAVGAALLVFLFKRSRAVPGSVEEGAEQLPNAAGSAAFVQVDEGAPQGGARRLTEGLAKTRGLLVERLDALLHGRRTIDEDLWKQLEEVLITSDVGVRTATHLLEQLRSTVDRDALDDPARLRSQLRANLQDLLLSRRGTLTEPEADSGPVVWVVVGVNGAGKTTTIGKLASRYVSRGNSVILGAGDTYRAAAIDQLEIWGNRAGAAVVRHEEGSDPAAVAHDAVTAGVARGADLVICDTAGRLHTKGELMAELSKVARVTSKVLEGAPHEVLLVLDATNGQNALAQAREFAAAVGVTGIALTKLDGTARGGMIVGIAHEFDIPVKLIGVGEGIEDLRDFEPDLFLSALFDESSEGFGRGSSSRDASIEHAVVDGARDPEVAPPV